MTLGEIFIIQLTTGSPNILMASPLLPSTMEWIVILFGAVHLLMFLFLLFWLPKQKMVNPAVRLVGIIVALLVPVIGPLAVWFGARRNTATGKEHEAHHHASRIER
ncbi:hypothetical protein GCM10023190_13790 [Enteractinococcus fodinae]|uniref:Uncharacterized protein YneF (UPF0154 family) n=2 Tax=Enteractinococcus fodinae TaxID=684663 RepID=A0ABU2AZE2_9MICC|nr:uncharacterized protein YneF (UPF0154 family) [Enteractinococcus fodinae]